MTGNSGKPRATQTQVKHNLLDAYMDAWGGIILNGVRSLAATRRSAGKSFDMHFVYVDCNASSGQYPGELTDQLAGRELAAVWGSPVIGAKALDDLANWSEQTCGITIRRNVILIEKQKDKYATLLETLRSANLGERLCETTEFWKLRNGEIAVVNGDSTQLVGQLCRYTEQDYTYSLYLIDPYGATGIPLSLVRPIISRDRHDVIINMMYLDLHKKASIVLKEEMTLAEQQIIRNFDEMFGSRAWQDIVRAIGADGDMTELERRLVRCYQGALQAVDPTLAVKNIPLHFPDKQRTMYYLFLTTHDPTGALVMNKLLYKAGAQEEKLRDRVRTAKQQRHGTKPMLPGFENILNQSTSLLPRPDAESIAEEIMRRLTNNRVEKREIYRLFADDIYYANELDAALKLLKSEQRASWEGALRHDVFVTFSQ